MFRKSPSGSAAQLIQNFANSLPAPNVSSASDVEIASIAYTAPNGLDKAFFSLVSGELASTNVSGSGNVYITATYTNEQGTVFPLGQIANTPLPGSGPGVRQLVPYSMGLDLAQYGGGGTLSLKAGATGTLVLTGNTVSTSKQSWE